MNLSKYVATANCILYRYHHGSGMFLKFVRLHGPPPKDKYIRPIIFLFEWSGLLGGGGVNVSIWTTKTFFVTDIR